MKRREFLKISGIAASGSILMQNAWSVNAQQLVNLKPSDARFVWLNSNGEGRNQYAWFRKSFQLSENVKEAEISIFADNDYQLFVNGQFVQFGPVRFDPRFPLYDIHNIAPYLKKGTNVIAIQACHYGMKTYRSVVVRAGLIAWGNIVTPSSSISLATKKNSWKCIASTTNSRYVSKYSFALNPADLYDQTGEIDWRSNAFDDNKWLNTVELEKQNDWGILKPRNIPFMELKPVAVDEVKFVLPLKNTSDIYSFSVPIPSFYNDENPYSNFIAFKTYIYSPVKQQITIGRFWCELWFNGTELNKGIASIGRNMLYNNSVEVNEGWNYLFGKVGAYHDIFDFYISLPQNAGLILSATREQAGNIKFFYTPLLKTVEYDNKLSQKALPYAETDSLTEIGGWINTSAENVAQSPYQETDWDNYAEAVEKFKPADLNGAVFSLQKYPHGFSILLNLDYIHLVIPTLEMEGVKGAKIDITYSEMLLEDQKHLFHEIGYWWGDRLLCTNDKINWMATHPRGVKFCKITVRNTTADVILKKFNLLSAAYPVKETGSFKCSDNLLNEIWAMCWRTQRANMEDGYDDTVGRERGIYIRDVTIQYHNNLAAFGDAALMNRCFELYGQSNDTDGKFKAVYPNSGHYTIADFCLNAVEGYHAYYYNTGDLNRIATDWDAIKTNIAWFDKLSDEHADGLLDSEWHIHRNIKAMYGGFHGDLSVPDELMDNTGYHCTFTCAYLITLRCAYNMAMALNKPADAAMYQQRVARLEKTIPQTFWNEEKGAFADNHKKTTYSAHATIFAIRAGVVSANMLEKAKVHLRNSLQSVFVNGYDNSKGVLMGPSFAFYIFDGLYKAGMPDLAENLIREMHGFFLYQGARTTPEHFNMLPSLCHAWSASPIYYLSKYGLGINFPQAPNFNKVEIKVETTHMQWAEGKWPHPNGGVIEVKWHTENGKRVFDYVKGPEGVSITVLS